VTVVAEIVNSDESHHRTLDQLHCYWECVSVLGGIKPAPAEAIAVLGQTINQPKRDTTWTIQSGTSVELPSLTPYEARDALSLSKTVLPMNKII